MTPLLFLSSWLYLRFGEDPNLKVPTELFGIMVLLWTIAANSHIVRVALEWSGAASVALVILQFLAGFLLTRAIFYPTSG